MVKGNELPLNRDPRKNGNRHRYRHNKNTFHINEMRPFFSSSKWPENRSSNGHRNVRTGENEIERNETPLMMMMTTVPVTSGNHIDYQCL